MKVKKLAQSTLLVKNNIGGILLIDPGNYNLEPGRLTLDDFPTADAIIITHKHADHFDINILKSLLRRSSPEIFTNKEIKNVLLQENIKSVILELNNKVEIAGFSIMAVKADHIVRGENVLNFGIVVSADNSSFYNTSDTLFMDPSSLPKETNANYLFVPISNRGVTMDMNEAIRFTKGINPNFIIPVHYDSLKDKEIDPNEFVKKACL